MSPKGFRSEARFTIEAYSSPAREYAPIYTWMWNGKVTEETTDRELSEMVRLGIKRIYILPMPKSFRPTSFPTPLEPEYLSEGYFEAYRYAVNKARSLGMEVWLYDEGGWPSGGACGQVMLEDPALVRESIRAMDRTVRQGEKYIPTESAEAAFLGGKRVYPGDTFLESGSLTEYLHIHTSFPSVNSADLPDITKEGTAPLFIALTHEKYLDSLKEDLGGLSALFTDEPTAPRPFPYNKEIKALFRDRFHREIEDCLPFLTGREKCAREEASVKIGFYRMLSDLFVERFLKKEKAWAKAHDMTYTGHLDKDDEANASVTSGCFGLLPALRVFDVPGVDAIRRQIFPPKGKKGLYGRNAFYPILAASAAAQTGGRHALSENFAVYGAGLSYEEMRYVADYLAICGVNVCNMMLIPYRREGYSLAGELPHFTAETYPDLALFNGYLERLSYLASMGRRVARVALYLPAEDGIAEGADAHALSSYEALGRDLLERKVPFDIADDGFFSFARVKGGRLTAGVAEYDTVLLPACEYLSESTITALEDFAATGGKVLTVSPTLTNRIKGARLYAEHPPLSPLPITEEGILLALSETEEGEMYLLMNEKGEEATVSLPLRNEYYLITPTDGKVRRGNKGEKVTLASGEVVCILSSKCDLPLSPTITRDRALELTDWVIRPVERRVIDECCHTMTLDKRYAATRLGDWKDILGENFSGKAEYRTRLSLPPRTKGALLDLGKVAHSAEVIWNGVSLGSRVMAPYRYEIPDSLLKEENELVVKVTSGITNEFETTSAFSKYYPWQLGNYLEEERRFHSDSRESGLFGKVKLYYK